MNENMTVAEGDEICTFTLDGVKCGVLTCNDLKFPEPSREIALRGAEMLFVPSAWPDKVMFRLHPLVQVRAIENQMFVINCNTCSKTSKKVNGGGSTVVAPFGQVLAKAGSGEEIFSCVCDLGEVQTVRANGQHFVERRRPELYKNL